MSADTPGTDDLREVLSSAIGDHNIECTGRGEVTCRCREHGWMSWPQYREHVASQQVDALLASDWYREYGRLVAERAWDEGFKQGGPMHDVNYDDPDAHKRNPYRQEATP